MRIILTNGHVLAPIVITGGKKTIQGATRDSLTFVFDGSNDMSALDSLFIEENCEEITIVEYDENGNTASESLHKGYVLRVELVKKIVTIQEATSESDEVTESRITVTMAQRTYAETKLAENTKNILDTQMAVAELGVVLSGGDL